MKNQTLEQVRQKCLKAFQMEQSQVESLLVEDL
jgi:hypothetical protein